MEILGVQVTQSNIAIMFVLLTAIGTGFVTLYWTIRGLWAAQEQRFEERFKKVVHEANVIQTAEVQTRLDAQTHQIEHCIHQTPGHPENKNNIV
jgi:hypothetical protein